MCGRAYETYTEEELEARFLNDRAKRNPLGIRANYNLSPTQTSPIVRVRDGDISIAPLRWGLIPAWAKDHKIAQINARGETAAEKPMFRSAFKSRRCIVPFSGFIEWKREAEAKRPFAISLKDEPIMAIAGLWEAWKSPDGHEVETFCVLTTGPNEFMEKIHDRMPVILDRSGEEAWLDPKANPESLQKLIKACPSAWLKAHEISTAINSPKNNKAELLEPVGPLLPEPGR